MYILNVEQNKEIRIKKLFASLSIDSKTDEHQTQRIEVGDLYKISRNDNNYGVVVKVNPGSTELIDNYNQRHIIPNGGLGLRLNKKRQLTNRHGQLISPKSTVKLIDGPYKESIAHVLAVHDQVVFVKL